MLKKMLALTGAVMAISGAAFAQCPCSEKKDAEAKVETTEKAKLIEVKVCPMMGAPVKGEGSGNQVVGQYKVYFCCGGCKGTFNKLSAEDQQKRIADALKKQEAAKTTG